MDAVRRSKRRLAAKTDAKIGDASAVEESGRTTRSRKVAIRAATREKKARAAENAAKRREVKRSAPVKPRDAPVPFPFGGFTKITNRADIHRSEEVQEEKRVRQSANRAQIWLEHVPTFKIKGVRLSELAKRAKNSKADIEHLEEVFDDMQAQKADACSALFVDEDGEKAVATFGFQDPNAEDYMVDNASEAQPYPGPDKRTLAYLKKCGEKIHWDGIIKKQLDLCHEASQQLCHFVPPEANERDIRHPAEKVMQYECADPSKTQNGRKEENLRYERTGVLHLVHGWYQQGHTDRMTQSRDMTGRTASGQMAVHLYFKLTRPVAQFLKECFKVSFPDYYAKYEAALEAGVWLREDPGPWLGRAVVWKLEVKMHQDGLDDGPAAIFNFGEYEGGELYLPDLRLKLQYGPGQVVIFRSGILYHAVAKWTPKVRKPGDKLTPGRVSHVFFFPKKSYQALEGKPKDWHRNSMGGAIPCVGKL